MNDEARMFLEKARESFASAESDLGAGRFNSCANRCYYACFQAAIAALIDAGVRASNQWGHDFVAGRFTGDLVNRRHRYPTSLRNTLAELGVVRQRGDYDPLPVAKTAAERAVRRAREFVGAVEQEL